MNRTQFLHTILPLGLGAFFAKNALAANETSGKPLWQRTPKYLQPGDTIAITCPASPLETKEAQNCISTLQSWGFKTKIGRTVGNHWQRFSGTDEERATELQALLDDENVSAILFGRGGYGVMRMMDKINWAKFIAHPKWLIGFSDITAIHCHINALYKIPTLHGPMAASFCRQPSDVSDSIRKVLIGDPIEYTFKGHSKNIGGQTTAELIGGNLSLICAMQASTGELKTANKILFIEDVSEYKYTIDRMLMTLKRSGKLENLAALIVGGMTGVKQDAEPDFPVTIEEMIADKVKEYNYPVCFNFPAGHQSLNLPLKLGIPYQLTVSKNACSLKEVLALKITDDIAFNRSDSSFISMATAKDSVDVFH